MTRRTAQAAQWGAVGLPEGTTSTFRTSRLRMSPLSWYRLSGDLCTRAFVTCGSRQHERTLHRADSRRCRGRACEPVALSAVSHLRVVGSLDEQEITHGHRLDAFGVAKDVLRETGGG